MVRKYRMRIGESDRCTRTKYVRKYWHAEIDRSTQHGWTVFAGGYRSWDGQEGSIIISSAVVLWLVYFTRKENAYSIAKGPRVGVPGLNYKT